MQHTHQPEHKGPVWEVCACGATRRAVLGEPPSPWHACELCASTPKAPIQ